MTKIGFFAFGILEQAGGLEKYYIDMAEHLAKTGNDVHIYTLDDRHTKSLLFLLSIFYMRRFDPKIAYRDSSKNIKKQIIHSQYSKISSFAGLRSVLSKMDVIYVKNEIIELAVLRVLVGYKNLPRTIIGCHTPLHYPIARSAQSKLHNLLYGGRVYRWLSGNVKDFHVLNGSDASVIKNIIRQPRIYKIQNPFSLSTYMHNRESFKIMLKADPNTKRILWVGRLSLQKGIDDLCELISRCNDSSSTKVTWTIVGDGSEREKIINLANQYDNVHWLGHVENKVLPYIYSQHNALVVTSHWEGYPYTILEANAAGIPVIAYDIPGCNDIITSPEIGYLVNNIQSFTDAITKYLDGGLFKKVRVIIDKEYNTKIYRELNNMFVNGGNKTR
jgi:glycosyltransferase involved in cell wall biosynthesis